MLRNVIIEENSPNRFQVQIFESSLAVFLAVFFLIAFGGGIVNFSKGLTGGAVMLFLAAAILMIVFAYFVAVRRITIDRNSDLVHLTSRAILRTRQTRFKLSDVKAYSFTRCKGEGLWTQIEPDDDQESRWGYSISMIMNDDTRHNLYSTKGTHVFALGHALRSWLDEHQALTDHTEAT